MKTKREILCLYNGWDGCIDWKVHTCALLWIETNVKPIVQLELVTYIMLPQIGYIWIYPSDTPYQYVNKCD